MRKVIYGICAVAFIVAAAINVNISLKSEKGAKVSLVNVLALANEENPGDGENKPKPDCPKVEKVGAMWITTVCDSKTDLVGSISSNRCNAPSNTTCQYSSVCY